MPDRPDKKPFLVRVDARLFEELKKWADDELRSVNGQIEYVLKRAVEERKKQQPPGQNKS